ncbi:MAG: hypothetical protein HY954_01275 [Deltaproteobacteria bacterium]|nr:hypothetical protein [Deltaproteobacteria bacterium]
MQILKTAEASKESPAREFTLTEELESTKEELAKRVTYLEDFRAGVFHMIRDLDRNERELEDTCRKLKDTQDQLIQSSKMTALGELAAGLAHEINQPLTIIKGLSQNLIKNCERQSPLYEKLQLITESSRRMESVINHLRAFSRLETQEFKPIEINSIINGSFAILKEVLKGDSIALKTTLSPLPLVLGSANRLEQVLINLVTNARDAMPGGGVIEITTGQKEANGRKLAFISFHDTGPGIPKEAIEKIFDPFFTTKSASKGTGLGLYICRGIIKEHQGDITVESAPGQGATFQITIPSLPALFD